MAYLKTGIEKTAFNLISMGMTDEVVCQATGLPETRVSELRKGLANQ